MSPAQTDIEKGAREVLVEKVDKVSAVPVVAIHATNTEAEVFPGITKDAMWAFLVRVQPTYKCVHILITQSFTGYLHATERIRNGSLDPGLSSLVH